MNRHLVQGKKHIGINAHLLSGTSGYRRAGIHHYIGQLLSNLSPIGGDLNFTVYTNNKENLKPNRGMRVMASRWPTSQRAIRIFWEQLAWPILAASSRVDLLHSLAFVTPILTRRKTVVTVYDLSFIYFPDRFPSIQRAYLTTQTRRSCQQARRVVAISESGRTDIHRQFDIPLHRIDVVYPGVDNAFYPLPANEVEEFKRKNKLHNPYILHVGTLQPRKNIPVLIDAVRNINRPDVELVLVGGKGWLFDEIFNHARQGGLADRVRFAGYVSDLDLPFWYNGAAMVVLPSEYEGFGMPAAQAMACGIPVIASNISAFPEVTGGAALLFDPYDVSALADHIQTVLDDKDITATMQAQGLDQVQKFSWQKAGRKMVEIYEKVLAES